MAQVQTYLVKYGSFSGTADYLSAVRIGSMRCAISLGGIKMVDRNRSAGLQVGPASVISTAPFWGGREGSRRSILPRDSTRHRPLQVYGTFGTTIGVRWWQKSSPHNMTDINSAQELLDALTKAGEKLVVVEFFGTWCGACRALYPKLCQIAEENPDIVFLKMNFESNAALCRSLDVKVLPLFHFYRGAAGRLDSFSCSLFKVKRLRNAIAKHNSNVCSIGMPLSIGERISTLSMEARALAASAV